MKERKEAGTRDFTRSSREFDFLRDVRIVFKWARLFSGLPRPDLETLLYLYPQGAFTKNKFYDYRKIVAVNQGKAVKKFLEEGWMELSVGNEGERHTEYVLSQSAKILCSRMHKMLLGLEKIPEQLFETSEKRIDEYYDKLVKRANKEV